MCGSATRGCGALLSDDHYRRLQDRLRALLTALSSELATDTAGFLSELVDANECGVALETLSETLYTVNAQSMPNQVAEVRSLAVEIGVDSDVGDRLAGLVIAPDRDP